MSDRSDASRKQARPLLVLSVVASAMVLFAAVGWHMMQGWVSGVITLIAFAAGAVAATALMGRRSNPYVSAAVMVLALMAGYLVSVVEVL